MGTVECLVSSGFFLKVSIMSNTSPQRQRVNAVPKAQMPNGLNRTRGFTCLRCGLVLGLRQDLANHMAMHVR